MYVVVEYDDGELTVKAIHGPFDSYEAGNRWGDEHLSASDNWATWPLSSPNII